MSTGIESRPFAVFLRLLTATILAAAEFGAGGLGVGVVFSLPQARNLEKASLAFSVCAFGDVMGMILFPPAGFAPSGVNVLHA